MKNSGKSQVQQDSMRRELTRLNRAFEEMDLPIVVITKNDYVTLERPGK